MVPTKIQHYLGLRPEKGRRKEEPIKSIGVACGREHTLILTTLGQVAACRVTCPPPCSSRPNNPPFPPSPQPPAGTGRRCLDAGSGPR